MLWNPPLDGKQDCVVYEPELEALADVLPADLGTLK
jgi:hypothetical protein